MTRLFLLAILVFSSICGCFAQAPSAEVGSSDLSDIDSARLAVYRTLLKPWVSGPRSKSPDSDLSAFYFAIEKEKDPSPTLLKSLGGMRLPARKFSEAFISDADGSIVLDRKSKRRGILFRIYELAQKSADEFEIAAGSHEGNMGAYECIYVVRRSESGWAIAEARNCMIS